MICRNCGVNLPDNQPFCPNCGAQQVVAAQAKKLNIFEFIAAALMALGTLLPCYSVFGYSVSYIQGDGIIVLILAIAVAVLTAFKKEKFAVIPAVLSAVLLLVLAVNLSSVGIGSIGFGMILMWIGTIAAIVLPFVPLQKK